MTKMCKIELLNFANPNLGLACIPSVRNCNARANLWNAMFASHCLQFSGAPFFAVCRSRCYRVTFRGLVEFRALRQNGWAHPCFMQCAFMLHPICICTASNLYVHCIHVASNVYPCCNIVALISNAICMYIAPMLCQLCVRVAFILHPICCYIACIEMCCASLVAFNLHSCCIHVRSMSHPLCMCIASTLHQQSYQFCITFAGWKPLSKDFFLLGVGVFCITFACWKPCPSASCSLELGCFASHLLVGSP